MTKHLQQWISDTLLFPDYEYSYMACNAISVGIAEKLLSLRNPTHDNCTVCVSLYRCINFYAKCYADNM